MTPTQLIAHGRHCLLLGKLVEAGSSLAQVLANRAPTTQQQTPLVIPEVTTPQAPATQQQTPRAIPEVTTPQAPATQQQTPLVIPEVTTPQAPATQPEQLLARRLLACVAIEQQDWPLAAERWRTVLAAELGPAELTEARRGLALALIELGQRDEASQLIAQLAATEDGPVIALELKEALASKYNDAETRQAALDELHQRFPEVAHQSPVWLSVAGSINPEAPGLFSPADLTALGTATTTNTTTSTTSTTETTVAPDTSVAAATSANSRIVLTPAQTANQILCYLENRIPQREQLTLARQAVARPGMSVITPNTNTSNTTPNTNTSNTTPNLSTPNTTPNTAAARAAGAALEARYLTLLCNNLSSAAELAELQVRTQAFAECLPEHPDSWRLQVAAAVAAHEVDAVAALAARSGLASLQLWLAVARGEHTLAATIAQRINQSRYLHAADGRGLDLRPLTKVPKQAVRDQILLFTAVRNERDFMPWLLDYYRGLGVDWFFVVDNLSTDGTTEFLLNQPQVTVFASADSYRKAAAGMRWINELVRRYGTDNWCLYVDADEQLITPKQEQGGLRQLVAGMAARGEEILPAITLDTYPESLAQLREFRPGDNPLDFSRLLDPNIYLSGKTECCFFRARGGVRQRLFGTLEMLDKAPLIRGGNDRHFQESSHQTSYGRLSREPCALLHYKLLREALELNKPDHARDPSKLAVYKSRTAREQNQPAAHDSCTAHELNQPAAHSSRTAHELNQSAAHSSRIAQRGSWCHLRHRAYHRSGMLAATSHIPRGPDDFAYESPAQLEQLGLLRPIAGPGPAQSLQVIQGT